MKVKAEPSAKFATAKRSNGSVAAVIDNATSFDKRARVTPEILPPVTDTSNASKREPCALAKEGSVVWTLTEERKRAGLAGRKIFKWA